MSEGQDVLTSTFDVATLNQVENRLAGRETARGAEHAGQLGDPLPGRIETLEVGLLTVAQSRRLVDALTSLSGEGACRRR